MQAIDKKPYYNLMLILKKKHITQSQLGKIIGITTPSMNSKLQGKTDLKFTEAKKIAKFLGISLEMID